MEIWFISPTIMKYPVIHSIRTIAPPYCVDQATSLDWIASAAVKSGSHLTNEEYDEAGMTERIKKLMNRYGAGPDRIAFRRSHIKDYTHKNWDSMELFNLREFPKGPGLQQRNDFFANTVNDVFTDFYQNEMEPPDELVHVTCTGYASPDGAQRLVSGKGWESRVHHVYHMGCYAAYPTLHHMVGSLRRFEAEGNDTYRVDAVHTELCVLHMDPSDYSPEKLVINSLFGDGYVRYSAGLYNEKEEPSGGLRILSLMERQVPDTEELMTWKLADNRMGMTLSREIPTKIQENIKVFFTELFHKGGLNFVEDKSRTLFAIHPGGPRIIDNVQSTLDLSDSSVAASRYVLKNNGNMSSVTSPTIWKEIVGDESIPRGTPVAGVAFGPGLTISGALFFKT